MTIDHGCQAHQHITWSEEREKEMLRAGQRLLLSGSNKEDGEKEILRARQRLLLLTGVKNDSLFFHKSGPGLRNGPLRGLRNRFSIFFFYKINT